MTTRKSLILILLALVAYFLAARLGLLLATINKQASPVWPATGIAISFIYLFGYRTGVGIFIGAFLANWMTGLETVASLMIAAGNTLEAILAIYIFQKSFSKNHHFGQYAYLVTSLLSLFSATAVAATVGTSTLLLFSIIGPEDVINNWMTWWFGDTLGAIFIAPLAFKLSKDGFQTFWVKQNQLIKLFSAFLIAAILSYFVFNTTTGGPYLFVVFFSLLLVSHWFNSSWLYVLSFIICTHAIASTALGYGPFTGNALNENLIHLQLFLSGLGITTVGLGSLKNEGLLKLPRLALISGWFLSGIAFYFFFNLAAEKDTLYINREIQNSEDAIQQALQNEINLLQAGVNFLESSDYVARDEWRIFNRRTLKGTSTEDFNGRGIVFSSRTTDVKKFKAEVGIRENLDDFKIQPVPNIEDGMRIENPELNYIITYLEPYELNYPAIGINLASEKNRYDAAERARLTGQPAMTQNIQLVQDTKIRSGFLVYIPFYRKGFQTHTDVDRAAAFRGFIYAPFITQIFFERALKDRTTGLKLTAYFGQKENLGEPVFASKLESANSQKVVVHETTLAGLPVTFKWSLSDQFSSSSSLIASWLGFSGTLSTLFLAILFASLKSTTQNAEKIAIEKTRELLESQKMWQALTEVSPVGIYLTDPEGNCTYVNSAWTQLTGVSATEALGFGWIAPIHPDDKKRVLTDLQTLQKTQGYQTSYRYLRNGNEIVYVTGQAAPLTNDSGELTGFIGTIQDITELQNKQDALIASSRMSSLGEMASGIAHEINNPLTIIMGNAAKIESLTTKPEVDLKLIHNNSERIIKTVHRIAKIIKGLQAFARETSSELFQRVEIKDVIENTLELCRERFIKHGTQLKLDENCGKSLFFWGREEQIAQVLMNLLNNSFDAVQDLDEKWIKIEVTSSDAKIYLSVTDSGTGIDRKIEERMFSPFFTTKEVGKGTGLGLSISKGILDRHKGKIYIDHKSSNTKFVVELDSDLES